MRDGTFRNGNYKRFVFLGKRTVKEGECMAIWLLDGRVCYFIHHDWFFFLEILKLLLAVI